METKPEAVAATSNVEMQAPMTPEQVKLVQEKAKVLGRARELQSQLALARVELTKIDTKLLNAGFQIRVLACW